MSTKKMFYVIFIVVCILLAFSLHIYATDTIIQGAEDFIGAGNDDILNHNQLKKVSDTIFNMFFGIGGIVIIITGAILGIQFMLGSIEEKAEIKQSMKAYVWGAIIIYGAVGIWAIVVKVLQNIF